MDEKLKNKILLLVIVLMVGFLLMALSSNRAVGHIKRDLDQERYKRIVAEEDDLEIPAFIRRKMK